MRIACLGDSITYGYALENIHDRWTDLCAGRTGHEFLNFGVPGDSTYGMLLRCRYHVLPGRPDMIVLLGGANDINTSGEYESACGNMASMIKEISSCGIRVIVGIPMQTVPEMVNPVLWDWDDDKYRNEELCGEYCSWLKSYCDERGIPIADFRSAFQDREGTARRELYIDGLHPTAEGHRIMADVICGVLADTDARIITTKS